MDAGRLVVRLSVAAAVVAALLVVAWPGRVGPQVGQAVLARNGSAFPVPAAVGVYAAAWRGSPILVFVVSSAGLSSVDAVRGPGSATSSLPLPGSAGLRLFVLSAVANYNGCTAQWESRMGDSVDVPHYDGAGLPSGRILDPCWQGSWDAYRGGAPQTGPAQAPLAQLRVSVEGATLEGTGFDAPLRVH
ncbi:MAG: hypothetical protein ACYDBQ_09255 [Thermoplasmatota archaeon]